VTVLWSVNTTNGYFHKAIFLSKSIRDLPQCVHKPIQNYLMVLFFRGGLIKPWIFTEIKEKRHWDISANERFDMLKSFVNNGLYNWNINYLCNQWSPLILWVRISIRTRCTTLWDKVCQWLATGRWFSPGTPFFSTNKTDHHVITVILLKVAF
jgi:hypothetical protein